MSDQDPNGIDRICDMAIVGAGPAGFAAAAAVRGHGLNVVMIDEQPRPGGQLLRQPPETFSVANWLPGKMYDRPKSVLRSMQGAEGVAWRLGSTVLGIFPRSPYRTAADPDAAHEIWINGAAGCEMLRAHHVLIASGCFERPLPFPGWTLPGVMGAGAIQAFVKSQQFVPGKRFVLAGSHPLQLLVADQLTDAGADVAAVVFTQRLQESLRLFRQPGTMLQHHRQLTAIGKILWRLKRAGVPVKFGRSITGAAGDGVVESAEISELDPDGRIDRQRKDYIGCDRIGICHGFQASSELARQAGASVHLREYEGGWLVDHDPWFESSVSNLFVAGEITGLAGADAALEEGRIAALGILLKSGRLDAGEARRQARSSRRRLSRINGFARLLNALASPPRDLIAETMTDSTVLCRCESISLGVFQRKLRENPHIATADAAKLLTRVGMGLCQGRLCGANAARLIARERRLPLASVGPLQAQAPVKPVALADVESANRRRSG